MFSVVKFENEGDFKRRMSRMVKGAWGAAAAVFIWGVWNFEVNPFGNEVSVFPQLFHCSDWSNETGCAWVSYPSTTYKVDVDRQTVVSWRSGKEWPLKSEKDCVVVSKTHWSCGKKPNVFGFNDGVSSRAEDAEGYDRGRLASKTLWWLGRIMGHSAGFG